MGEQTRLSRRSQSMMGFAKPAPSAASNSNSLENVASRAHRAVGGLMDTIHAPRRSRTSVDNSLAVSANDIHLHNETSFDELQPSGVVGGGGPPHSKSRSLTQNKSVIGKSTKQKASNVQHMHETGHGRGHWRGSETGHGRGHWRSSHRNIHTRDDKAIRKAIRDDVESRKKLSGNKRRSHNDSSGTNHGSIFTSFSDSPSEKEKQNGRKAVRMMEMHSEQRFPLRKGVATTENENQDKKRNQSRSPRHSVTSSKKGGAGRASDTQTQIRVTKNKTDGKKTTSQHKLSTTLAQAQNNNQKRVRRNSHSSHGQGHGHRSSFDDGNRGHHGHGQAGQGHGDLQSKRDRLFGGWDRDNKEKSQHGNDTILASDSYHNPNAYSMNKLAAIIRKANRTRGNKGGRKKFGRKEEEEFLHELSVMQQIEYLSKSTRFTIEEIRDLQSLFRNIVVRSTRPNEMDRLLFRDVFLHAFGITNDIMLDQIYQFFDADHEGGISYTEFVKNLSIILRGSLEEQIKYCYAIYDLNGDGGIGKQEVVGLVHDCLNYSKDLEGDVFDNVRDVADMIMKKFDPFHTGQITKDQFREGVLRDPLSLQCMGHCIPDADRLQSFMACITIDYLDFATNYSLPNNPTYTHEKDRYGNHPGHVVALYDHSRHFKYEDGNSNNNSRNVTLKLGSLGRSR